MFHPRQILHEISVSSSDRMHEMMRYLQRRGIGGAVHDLLVSRILLVLCILVLTGLYLDQTRILRDTTRTAARDDAARISQLAINQNSMATSVQGCRRLSTLAAAENTNQFATFSFLLGLQRQGLLQSVPPKRVHRILGTYTWVPATPCQQRVEKQGRDYALNKPVRFIDRFPSPKDLRPPGPLKSVASSK